MGKEKTSWDTESGLLDDYDFVVKEAWFGTDEEVDDPDDRIFLFLRGEATVAGDDDVTDDEHRERYSTGKNWEVVEEGTEVENATGKNRFNQNAGVGRLINALVNIDGVAPYLASKGDAYEASTFEGLRMHMDRRVVSRWTGDDGEELEWELALPTSVKTKAKSKGKKSKKGGSGKASRAKGKGSKPSLRSDIVDFAAEFEEDEHDDFVDQVLDDDVFTRAEEIQEDDELHAEVLDADSELWSEAH